MFSLLVLSLISAIIAIITIILTAPTTSATSTIENSTGLNLSVNISQVMSIRTLDSTATSDISSLNYAITPTPAGVRQTNTTIVDVATSNVSGYKLMMNSDYRTDGTSSDTPSAAEFTTSLINTDSTIAATEVGQISTSAGSSTASSTSYWNYSKSWNESLGPEGQTKSFSSTTLADTINPSTNQPYGNTILENLAIPAKATPDTVRDDVDIATSSSQTSISVNVNAATDKSSGIYKNELVFTAIANPIPVDYTLTFNKNTEDTVANLPDPLTATTIATSYTFTIPDTSGEGTLPEMTRDGYSFVGWSTSASTRQGSGSGPDGLYIAGDTYTVVADDSGNPDYTTHGTGSSTLYAVWEEDAKDFWGITTMQEMTWEICQTVHYPNSTTATNTNNLVTDKATYESKNITSDGSTQWVPTRTLIDDRDADGTGTKRSYTVSRLADGNCWMTENLKYDLLSLYNNGKRGIGSKNDGSTFEMTNSSFASGVSGYYTSDNDAYNYVINGNTKSLSVTMMNNQLGDKTDTQYYYNWTGATAGQGSQSQSSRSINGSICPAGWVLPTGDTGNQSFYNLYNGRYNSLVKLEAYPLAFYRSGHLLSGIQGSATNGFFWSSTANDAYTAYGLYFSVSSVNPQNYATKNVGFQVRCVASRSV